MQLNEELRAGDLRDLVKDIFEIDSYKSKMGEDQDIAVLSFTVADKEPAQDLVDFVERGYDFVLDADLSTGELSNGEYKVFVEIERNSKIADQIVELLDGVGKLTEIKDFRFRYYKGFTSMPATKEELQKAIPTSKQDYSLRLKEDSMNNFSNFFNRSYLEGIDVVQSDLEFQKKFAEPIRMRILGFGLVEEIYNSAPGKLLIEHASISEALYLTKVLGNYNITKIGNAFVFENGKFAALLQKL